VAALAPFLLAHPHRIPIVMSLSLKPSHLKRYRDVARLIYKYADEEVFNTAGLDEALLLESERERTGPRGKAKEFTKDLERLGPTYIKLGQILSTRPDLLPPDYIDALSRLQDDVEPIAWEDVEATIQEELGVRISKAFGSFEQKPLAAASLGQVHRATLRDGRPVVVKVQRPGIRKIIFEDLDSLSEIADLAGKKSDIGRRYAIDELLDEFRTALLRELDYRQETQNLVTMRDQLKSYESIVVPAPVPDYSTSRVLTMEFVEGQSISSIGPLGKLEIDGRALAEDLFRAYLDQVLTYGFFHADPHPGNLLVTPEGRIAMLDLGMVAHLGPDDREQLLKLLLHVTEGQGKDAADRALAMGRPLPDFDRAAFTTRVETLVVQHSDDEMREVNIGRLLIELLRAAGEAGLRPPRSVALLGKTLLNLDEISRVLAPEMQPQSVVRNHAALLMQKQMARSLSPSNLFASALEAQELAQKLPPRINTILGSMAEDRFTLRINAFDEARAYENFHRMINRLSLSVVVAALIIGAAMLMQVDTEYTLFGYPGLAIILFLSAFAFGSGLAISIFIDKMRRNPY
jgi:ubiquinone biosynthesis protein